MTDDQRAWIAQSMRSIQAIESNSYKVALDLVDYLERIRPFIPSNMLNEGAALKSEIVRVADVQARVIHEFAMEIKKL